jgi:predicted 3-demethylubiquinone-9 3-methyltransferase (glyoxalase superfamily)
MRVSQRITPCLWFDDQAEEAVDFYTAIFRNSKIVRVARYGKAGYALNGGPIFKFNEAISFQVNCETQEEVDYYWEKLSEDGDEKAQQCGWLKDKYGVSWQVVPRVLVEMVGDPNSEKSQRAMEAMLRMKKIDIDKLKRAYAG